MGAAILDLTLMWKLAVNFVHTEQYDFDFHRIFEFRNDIWIIKHEFITRKIFTLTQIWFL